MRFPFPPALVGARVIAPLLSSLGFVGFALTAGAQSPDVTGTQTADIDETNADTKANPGEKIDYDIRLTNSGGNATNLMVEGTIDPNTLLDPASVMVGPIGIDDLYQVTGNLSIDVPVSAGVLANDLDPDGGATPVLTAPIIDDGATQGAVVVSSDGSFVYTPPSGFSGTDTFRYTVRDAQGLNGLSQGVVTLNVSSPIWFIDDSDALPDDATAGTRSNPFNTIASFMLRNDGASGNAKDGDVIYLLAGSGSPAGSFTLRASQTLLGQGVGLTLDSSGFQVAQFSVGLPSAGVAPRITGTANAINLAANNTIRGLGVGSIGPSNYAVSGTSFGSLLITDFSTSGTGGIFDLNTGSIDATQNISALGSSECVGGIRMNAVSGVGLTATAGVSITASTDFGVGIFNSTAPFDLGQLNVATTPSLTGLDIQNCPDVSSTSGAITGSVYVLNSGLDLTLTSVSANGVNGIDLDSTTGTFAITGDGGSSPNASGGLLQNILGNGISLTNAVGVSIEQLDIQSTQGNAIRGRDECSDLAFRHGVFTTIGTSAVPGLNAIDFDEVDGSGKSSVIGTLDIENITVNGFVESGLVIHNEIKSLVATVNGGTAFNDNDDALGQFGINVESNGAAAVTLIADQALFDQIEADSIRFEHDSSSDSQLTITRCTVTNGGGVDDSLGGGGIGVIASGIGGFNINIDDNDLIDITDDGILLDGALNSAQKVTAKIVNNDITATRPRSFDLGDGILVQKDSGGIWDVIIEGNTVAPSAGSASNLSRGIYTRHRDNSGTLTLQVAGNTISGTDNEGFRLFSDHDIAGIAPTTNVTLTGNTISNTGGESMEFRIRDTTTLCANIATNVLTAADVIKIDLGSSAGPMASITQADPAGGAPNLSTVNGGATIDTTSSSGAILFSQAPCPLPVIPTP